MDDSQTAELSCPYCGEVIEVVVDCSVHRQVYIEDCQVCCRPIEITLVSTEGKVERIEGRSEDD
jgi:hypothetical protein